MAGVLQLECLSGSRVLHGSFLDLLPGQQLLQPLALALFGEHDDESPH